MTSAAKSSAAKQAAEFTRIYRLPPPEKIGALRRGVSASQVGILSAVMHISKDTLTSTLGLSRATVSRKVLSDQTLSQDESERVLGVQALIGQVQAMVEESGDPAGFDASRWLVGWQNAPLPALGGSTPASYMDTLEGQKFIANLLAMTQSGAYA